MACWTLSALFVPFWAFALGAATDLSPNPPRYWQRPRSYGQALFLGAILWAIGWFGPVLTVNFDAFDRPDFVGAAKLLSALSPYLPAGLGVLFAGLGILLITTAPSRIGNHPHCGHCGYQRASPGYRLIPTCPECGQIWSWFGSTIQGKPHFNAPRAAIGLLLALLGATGIAVQQFI